MNNIERSAVGFGPIGPDSYRLEYRSDWNANVLVPTTHASMFRPVLSAMGRAMRRLAR